MFDSPPHWLEFPSRIPMDPSKWGLSRRAFLAMCGGTAVDWGGCDDAGGLHHTEAPSARPERAPTFQKASGEPIVLFLGGDVMTGRGIDQILPHCVDPRLYEPYVKDAREYVELAERESGPIPRNVDFSYVWGDALAVLDQVEPDLRIINLETSITHHDEPTPKGINYRMHPANIPVLTAAGIDCLVLGNNHVLDWETDGLIETLRSLDAADLRFVGAGRNLDEARMPATFELGFDLGPECRLESTSEVDSGRGRVLVFSLATPSSGVPAQWAASPKQPGVCFLPEASAWTAREVAAWIRRARKPGDFVVVSVHWGGNWGYDIPVEHIEFAHALVDRANVNVIHGHSSHHCKAIEVYEGTPIFYGCGDLLNDYEGIRGHEQYRDGLPLLYFPRFDPSTRGLTRLEMVPMRIHRFSLVRPSGRDRQWVRDTLDRECRKFGGSVVFGHEGRLELEW